MADWDKIKSRGRVDDRRGQSPMRGFGSILGGGGSMSGLGIAAIAIIVLASMASGNSNLVDVLDQIDTSQLQSNNTFDTSVFEGDDSYEVFASTVLGSNNDYWQSVFSASNRTYIEPNLVLFRGATASGCGGANSQVGPHYCSLDSTIYLDETFFDQLESRFGAKGGDVAEAYVLAHEVGHHIQSELGISEAVLQARRAGDPNANQLSVKLELQADCFAGLWAHSIKDLGIFGPNEIEEAISAAEAVGDDNIQESVTGRVDPESWTHGSSEQRVAWFTNGFNSGDPAVCDTF